MKNFIFTLIFLFPFLPNISAQWKWYNPVKTENYVIQGQGFTKEIGKSYNRLPDRAKGIVRDAVWGLSRNSAGLNIQFYSNAPEIKIRYQVTGRLSMPHMPSTGVSGVDMYRRENEKENFKFCFGGYAFKDTIVYSYANLAQQNKQKGLVEYRIYLPLYNSVKWMEIGIPENSQFKFIPKSKEQPIVVYGTSITQGACASRPGMAWINIVQRYLDYPFINLGFSGNGRLEKEVLDYINEIDARLYILDCIPNLSREDSESIYNKVVAAVRQIRKKHPSTPILLVEQAGYSNAYTDATMFEKFDHANKASRKAFNTLINDHEKNLFYLSREELNYSPEAWVDMVHPSDFGMQRQAAEIKNKVCEILHFTHAEK